MASIRKHRTTERMTRLLRLIVVCLACIGGTPHTAAAADLPTTIATLIAEPRREAVAPVAEDETPRASDRLELTRRIELRVAAPIDAHDGSPSSVRRTTPPPRKYIAHCALLR